METIQVNLGETNWARRLPGRAHMRWFAIVAALCAVGCGESSGTCGEVDLSRDYVDTTNGFQLSLEHDCAEDRVEGVFFDGDRVIEVRGSTIGTESLDIFGNDGLVIWRSDPFLEIVRGGATLAGDVRYDGDEFVVFFQSE